MGYGTGLFRVKARGGGGGEDLVSTLSAENLRTVGIKN